VLEATAPAGWPRGFSDRALGTARKAICLIQSVLLNKYLQPGYPVLLLELRCVYDRSDGARGQRFMKELVAGL
jgi:hypothetical protein